MNYTYEIKERDENEYRIDVKFENHKWAWGIFDTNGNLLKCNDDNAAFYPFPDELKNKAAEIINSLPKNEFKGKNVYIRFNDLPKSGVSTNWATGQAEAGISAYNTVYKAMTGEYFPCGALQGAEIAYLIKGASVYFITGDEVGTGADGEPVLANVEVLGTAKYNKKTGGYTLR